MTWLFLLLAVAAGDVASAAPTPLLVSLRVMVAVCDGRNTRDPAWVKAQVEAANQVFAPHGIRLSEALETVRPARCQVLTRSHRHAMAAHAPRDGRVPVLVVPRVRDLDRLDYDLQGVHWRYQGERAAWRGRRFIFLTARAHPPVLAHELCHFFGLAHDPAGGNLMTPGPSSPAWSSKTPPSPFAPILTELQVAKLRAGIIAWQSEAPR